ncbi:hypothetical protein ACIQ9P_39190 [Kitasatospora sp. NPDC094019]|uniref:hypothetical protein n=1 Tax=Kitasatospora sp. NPDC094019 TaxID=3364091 RepID=UPI00381D33DA
MTTSELMLLPHQPYVDAALRAFVEAGHPDGPDSFTEYDSPDGELVWLEATRISRVAPVWPSNQPGPPG